MSGRVAADEQARAHGATGDKLAIATLRAQARCARPAGWKRGIARGAVDEAMAHVGTSAQIELVIREALRRCPRPNS